MKTCARPIVFHWAICKQQFQFISAKFFTIGNSTMVHTYSKQLNSMGTLVYFNYDWIWPVNMTGDWKVWPVKSPIWADIVRWLAVIFSPVIIIQSLVQYRSNLSYSCTTSPLISCETRLVSLYMSLISRESHWIVYYGIYYLQEVGVQSIVSKISVCSALSNRWSRIGRQKVRFSCSKMAFRSEFATPRNAGFKFIPITHVLA